MLAPVSKGREASPTVAICANSSWYIYNFRRNLIESLTTCGYQVHVLVPEDEYTGRLEDQGQSVQVISMQQRGSSVLSELRSLYSVFRSLRSVKPDVVLSYTPKMNLYACLVAAILRAPVIANISGLGHIASAGQRACLAGLFSEMVFRIVFGVIFRRAHFIFFQNKDDLRIGLDKFRLPAEKCELLPGSGVDLKRFVPRLFSKQPGEAVFLMASRLLVSKGVLDYLAAAEKLKDSSCRVESLLAGAPQDGPGGLTIESIRAGLERSNTRYLGHIDDINNILGNVHCVVLPSTYAEGIPRILIEGAASGKLLIAYDSVGSRELVKDGVNGYLVPRGDVDALRRAMLSVCDLSKEGYMRMCSAAVDMVQKSYDETIVIDKYKSAIEALTVRISCV